MDDLPIEMLLANYNTLVCRVDEHLKAVDEKFSGHMACKKGCDACCRSITLFPVEALSVAAAFAMLPEKDRNAVEQKISNQIPGCPLLIDKACAIYTARPVICRTHGYPILLEKEGESRIDFCPDNFKGITSFPKETLLSLNQLNTALAAVNQNFLELIETRDMPERIPIFEALYIVAPPD